MNSIPLLLVLAFGFFASASGLRIEVPVDTEMARLLREIDRNHDRRITLNDWLGAKSPPRFWLKDIKNQEYEVTGIYYLSNLLQELKLASELKKNFVDSNRVFEAPVHRISRLIRESYWSALTRQIDADHISALLNDPKIPKSHNKRVLYVPEDDAEALNYFKSMALKDPSLNLTIESLKLGDRPTTPGLLSLGLEHDQKGTLKGIPFVVPGGRFNEMYGWDSYFEVLGLIHDQRVDLAKGLADNLIYEVEHYGKILNANRSYYLNRSQPPFLTSLIRALYAHMTHTPENKVWLERAVRAAIREYNSTWINPEHRTEIGLSRYSGGPADHLIPREVEPGHFDFILKPEATAFKLTLPEFRKKFETASLSDPKLDEFFNQDLAVRESGHDTTYRWRVNKVDRAADFVTVDLNALLYKYEIDLTKILEQEFGGQLALADGKISKASDWRELAQKRKSLMLQYLWNEKENLFFDYNYKDKVQSTFISATAIYPLWAIDPEDPRTKILNDRAAHKSFIKLLSELELPGGLASTAKRSRDAAKAPGEGARQWDYPNGWPPHQMLAWRALKNYGELHLANRLIYRWLYTITRNAVDYNGIIPEKFDVATRSHAVFAEYGNVGTNFTYITREGFGWMNASYQIGLLELDPSFRQDLDQLRPPEWIEF